VIDGDEQRSPGYRIGPRTLAIVYQDLSTIEADVIVSSDDNHLTMGGGVSSRLADAAGPCVSEHARKFVPPRVLRPSRRGDVIVTTAGALPARYLFHAVTIDLDTGKGPNEQVVEEATARCMQLAESLAMTSIAFPALGTGVGGFPFQAAARVMIRTITVALDSSTNIERATIALFSRAGVAHDELNAFYEDAVGQVALWQQTRRLAESLDQLVVKGALPEDRADALRAVLDEVRGAEERLDSSTPVTGGPGELEEASSFVELGRRVATTLSEHGSLEDEAATRAELEQLRYEHNAKRLLLLQHQTNLALGGPSGPESERRITDVTRELADLSTQIASAEERLARLSR
jgi:O-acetyl-ADP-ribose deacetylase (regulator of RNase III)